MAKDHRMVLEPGLKFVMRHQYVSKWVCIGGGSPRTRLPMPEMQNFDVEHSGHAIVLIE